MMFQNAHSRLWGSLIVLATGATVANAQNAQLLDEVVVTATKRVQTLQEIPIAVSVTDAETIEQAQIQDILDLQSVVPSLRVTQLQTSRNTNFVIRGFGNGANNPGIEPSVGLFIDGVYRSRSAAALSDLPRLERVEVLRGPQSTLFGKNASAGVISVVTPVPSGESGGYISGSFGNYDALVVKGLYEGAITDNLVFDISATSNQRDGYYENLVTGEALNDRNRWSTRGQLYYTPTDNTEFRFIVDYDEIDELCCGVANLFSGPATGAILAVGGNVVPNDAFAYENFYDIDSRNEVTNSGMSLQADIDFENFTITSITSLRDSENFDTPEIDFTSANLVSQATNDINIETFTQEIRFTSTGDGNVDWLFGAFLFDEEVEYTTEAIFGSAFRGYADALVAGLAPGILGFLEGQLGLPVGATFFAPGTGAVETTSMENDAVSFFTQFDWHIGDTVTATAGLNYTIDDKEASVSQVNTDVFSSLPLGAFGLEALQPFQFLPPFVNFPNAVENGKTDDEEVTYTVRLAWDVSDSVSVYGSYGTGFKASSWNLSRDSRPFPGDIAALTTAGLVVPNLTTGTRFAGPEESTVAELGLKARFEKLSLNMALFEQDIEGFQSNLFIGTGFILANAGKQSTRGFEFDLAYYPIDSLQINLAGTLLDPEYDSFPQGTDTNGPADLSGTTPAGIHETSISAGATYNFTLGGKESYIRGDYQFDDDVQVVDNVSAQIASREVSQLNLSAGMIFDNGMTVTLWGRNLTDDTFLLSAFPSLAQTGSFSGYPNQPRTYGITLRKDF